MSFIQLIVHMTLHGLHPAATSRSVTSAFVIALACALLAGCETPLGGSFGSSGETRAEQLAATGRHDESASQYIYLASSAVGVERDRLTMLAVEQWLDAGDIDRARNAFSDVAKPVPGPRLPLWTSNAAALALYDGDADKALGLLEPLDTEPLPRRSRLRIDALTADAWIQKGQPGRAVALMVQRELWLNGRRELEHSRNRLWKGLLYSDPQTLRSDAANTDDNKARGWLLLAALARSTGQQGPGWQSGLAQWRASNAEHPALTVIGDAASLQDVSRELPQQVALLLPLSGRDAALGHAIQNGFLGAYFSAAASMPALQTVRVYDIGRDGGVGAAYRQAIDDGAGFVVGPLRKNDATNLVREMYVPVPLLTLNYLNDGTVAPPGVFQFALAPEDEAASVAVRALGDGHRRGVALVPDNPWGRKVLQSFATEFEGLGGTLLDYHSYSPKQQDYSKDIEALMGLSGSIARFRRLRANIGDYNLQFDPRRREDSEFIFLAADADQGRLLKAQLKFHFSGDLPTYSTSLVNSLDGRSNTDLNGIMFADIPWLIDPHPWIQHLPRTYTEHWPRERALGRFHAMGYDAYNLISALLSVPEGSIPEIEGATGTLFLDQFGRIHRRLSWARFEGGEVVTMPGSDPAYPDGNTGDDIPQSHTDSASSETAWNPAIVER